MPQDCPRSFVRLLPEVVHRQQQRAPHRLPQGCPGVSGEGNPGLHVQRGSKRCPARAASAPSCCRAAQGEGDDRREQGGKGGGGGREEGGATGLNGLGAPQLGGAPDLVEWSHDQRPVEPPPSHVEAPGASTWSHSAQLPALPHASWQHLHSPLPHVATARSPARSLQPLQPA